MVKAKKKRHVARLEDVQADFERTYPKFELCSYDYLAYLAYPELNKLAKPSRVYRYVADRQKKFLSEITLTLRRMQFENRPKSYASEFLSSKEFNDFQDILMRIYLHPKIQKSDEAMAIYTNLIIMGAHGIKQIMPKSFHPVLDRDLIPLQKLCHSIAEYSKKMGKKGELAYQGLTGLDFTIYDGL